MDRTSLGLQRVPAGESIFDGFTTVDRDTIDRLLRIGALLHRHDAHAALPAPTLGPDITVEATGGALPAGSDFYSAVTALDAAGGETIIGPVNVGLVPLPLLDVPEAPTAVVDYTAGTLPPNTYYYVVTVTDDSGGESEASDPVEGTVIPGAANARVLLSGLTAIVDSVGGTGWRLYRSTNGGELGLLGQDLEAVDTFTDDGAPCLDPQLQPPVANTSGGTSKAVVTVPAAALDAAATGFRLYASPLNTFEEPSLVGTYTLADLDTPIEVLDFGLQSGAPPAVSTALAGAAKITMAELAADVIAALGGGGGGGGGGGPFVLASGDTITWVFDPAADPVDTLADLSAGEGGGGLSSINQFEATDVNPAPSLFDAAGTLTPKVGTSEADWHGFAGLSLRMADNGGASAQFILNDADAGWDTLGVGFGEMDPSTGVGIFAILDRAAGELQLVHRAAPGPYTVLDSAAVSGLADADVATVILRRSPNANPALGHDYEVMLNLNGSLPVDFVFTSNVVDGWYLWPHVVAGWTDPTAFSVEYVDTDDNDSHRYINLNVYSKDGSSVSRQLLDDTGTLDVGIDPNAPALQRAGVVAADGTSDTARVIKTGVGTYDVWFWGFLSEAGPPIVVTDPGGATISNVSRFGFSIDFGADTAFRFIAAVAT